jgi:tRNA pseudouridine13 synthase
MKDRNAITTQMLSVPFPPARSESEALALELPGISVAQATRHEHKLKPGHLKGNRFSIVLRDVADVGHAADLFARAGAQGVPNAFGPQRFGRDGDNAERALAWLGAGAPGPGDRRNRRLIFSALQAHFFNRVLARREIDGTWMRPLAGDLVKKSDTGGMFVCADPEVDARRAELGEICPTGPIFGAKMRWPEGEPARIEREILAEAPGGDKLFDDNRALGEGSRRPLALFARDVSTEKLNEDQRALRVEFVLPKGGYATTFLSSAVALHEEKTVSR